VAGGRPRNASTNGASRPVSCISIAGTQYNGQSNSWTSDLHLAHGRHCADVTLGGRWRRQEEAEGVPRHSDFRGQLSRVRRQPAGGPYLHAQRSGMVPSTNNLSGREGQYANVAESIDSRGNRKCRR
jgi:hypothetical protein